MDLNKDNEETENEHGMTSVRMKLQVTSATDENEINSDFQTIVQPDGGWGWVVCFSCVICNGVVFGTMKSFGILYPSIKEKYSNYGSHISFRAAWIGSVCVGTTFLLSLLAGMVSDSIGVRKTGFIGAVVAFAGMLGSAFVEDLMLLYLTFGLIMGLGFSFVLTQSFVILGHYFKRHLGLASGLNSSGGAIFTVGISLGLPVMLKRIGLHKSLLAMAGFITILVPCALAWKAVFPTRSSRVRDPQNSRMKEESSIGNSRSHRFCRCGYFNAVVWQNKNFLLWVSSFSIAMLGYFVPYVHVVKYVQDVFPSENGSLLILVMSASAGVFRLIIGKVADFRWISRTRIVVVGMAGFGLCTICIPFAQCFEGLIALSIAVGIFDGAMVSGVNPIVYELVGQVNLTQALGIAFVGMGLTNCAGSPLVGLLYDTYGNYNLAFYFAGGVCILASIMMAFVNKPRSVQPEESPA